MLAITLIVCLAAGLSQFAIRRLVRRRRPRPGAAAPLPGSRRSRLGVLAVTAFVAIGLAVAAGVPGKVENRWEQFKDPEVARASDRLDSASGNGRYQWWTSAVDAFETAPVLGIGSGTFEFWWARNATIPSSLVDAHSLYFETLGELGLIGLLLVVAAVGGILLLIARMAMRAPPAKRARLAAVAGAGTAFAVAAASDWVWELPILPICFLLLAAAALASREPGARAPAGADVAAAGRGRVGGHRRDRTAAARPRRDPLEPATGRGGEPRGRPSPTRSGRGAFSPTRRRPRCRRRSSSTRWASSCRPSTPPTTRSTWRRPTGRTGSSSRGSRPTTRGRSARWRASVGPSSSTATPPFDRNPEDRRTGRRTKRAGAACGRGAAGLPRAGVAGGIRPRAHRARER